MRYNIYYPTSKSPLEPQNASTFFFLPPKQAKHTFSLVLVSVAYLKSEMTDLFGRGDFLLKREGAVETLQPVKLFICTNNNNSNCALFWGHLRFGLERECNNHSLLVQFLDSVLQNHSVEGVIVIKKIA